MELLGKVIVYPVLWIVYIMLPFLNGPLSSLPSFKPSFSRTASLWRKLDRHSAVVWGYPSIGECLCFLAVYFLLIFPGAVAFWLVASDILTTPHYWLVSVLLSFAMLLVGTILAYIFMYASFISFFSLLSFIAIVLILSLECFYFLRLFMYPVIKAVTHIFIVGFKNRRACQFLSALAAVVLGVTKAKLYAAIPIAYGIFLTIPDLDPDPWMRFKVSFSHFLMANMDEESLDAVLYSKSFKMVSCNEMMPVLRPVRPTIIGACFVLRERFRLEDRHFTVEPEYKIGLGSIATTIHRDDIHVQIFTPYSGVRRRRMKNTPGARFNLDMSARFWRNHPELGILNEVISTYQHYDEAKIHCISVDKWITFCGSENYVFMEYDEFGTSIMWRPQSLPV